NLFAVFVDAQVDGVEDGEREHAHGAHGWFLPSGEMGQAPGVWSRGAARTGGLGVAGGHLVGGAGLLPGGGLAPVGAQRRGNRVLAASLSWRMMSMATSCDQRMLRVTRASRAKHAARSSPIWAWKSSAQIPARHSRCSRTPTLVGRVHKMSGRRPERV